MPRQSGQPGRLRKEFTDRLFASRARAPAGTHEFDQLCTELGIEHRLTPPKSPQTNGKPVIGKLHGISRLRCLLFALNDGSPPCLGCCPPLYFSSISQVGGIGL